MASNLGTRDSQNEFRKFQQRQLLRSLRQKRVYTFVGPWGGYAPDLPRDRYDLNFFQDIRNLVVKPGPSGEGEVLINDAGYEKANAANLPLGDNANTTNDICHIAQFNMTGTSGVPSGDSSTSLIAVTAGDGSNAGSQQVWRITANTANWAEVPASGAASTAALSATINGDTTALHQQSMVDSAEFPLGAPGRSAHSGAVSTPAFVFTNNVDEVMIFPAADTNLTDYEHLTDRFTAFRCISVETYNDRMYFLNTEEGGTRVRNRIRRSARGTCDPLETTAGAGSLIVEELSTGLRLLTLSDVMVAYFTDGVAFVRDTFNSAAPNAVQILTERRGILSTHSVCDIPGIGHFGIYNDGWWILDPNGRFTQVGFVSPDRPVEKWKRKFYANLDFDNAHRIHCTYEARRNFVRIVVPVTTGGSEVWTYDVTNNRVFRDNYPVQPTVFGVSIVNTDTAETWADQVDGTDTWSAIVGTWDAFASEQGSQFVLHGDIAGNVFLHKDDIITQDGNDPNWLVETIDSAFGDIRSLKRADRVEVSHVNASNNNSLSAAVTGSRGSTTSRDESLNQGTVGDVEVAQADFLGPTAEELRIKLSGSGPVQIKNFQLTTIERGSERLSD